MGSFVDQFADTQPPPLSGDDCKGKDFPGCRFPFMETAPFGDGLDTQDMDFEDETQVLFEDGLETQVMNFEAETQVLFENGLDTQVMSVDETQVLDDFDDFDNLDTQLLDEWNNEETEKTDCEVSDKTDRLCDTDDKSENKTVKLVVHSSPNRENTTVFKKDEKANEAELDALFYKQKSSGVKVDFTSIRVAAIQASGLAARRKALGKNASEICSSKSDVKVDFTSICVAAIQASGLAARRKALGKNASAICSSKSDDVSLQENPTNCSPTSIRTPLVHSLEIDESALEAVQVKERKEGNKGMIRKAAVRRLSMDGDNLVAKEGLHSNYQYEIKIGELPLCNELSYVDSEGPGDLSEAIALNFIDKFVKLSNDDITKAFEIAGSTTQKSKLVSGIKGTQTLARNNALKSISDDENGIYDWDDNLEDEGGGEFFSRKKKVIFDDEVDRLTLMHSLKRTAKKGKANLLKDIDEELNVDLLKGTKATCLEKDFQRLLNIMTNTERIHKGASIGEKDNTNLPHKYFLRKRCGSFNPEDLTRKPKQQNLSVTGRKVDKRVCKEYYLRKRSSSFSSEDLTIKSKQQKVSGLNLNGKTTVASFKQCKRDRKQHKDSDTSNVVLPRSGREQVGKCVPIASQPKKLSMRKQSIGDKVTYHTFIEGSSDDGREPANQHSNTKPFEISERSQSFFSDQGVIRLTRSSLRVTPAFPLDKECETDLFNQGGDKEELEEDILKTKLGEHSNFGQSAGGRSKSSALAASPICMGDEYFNLARKKNMLKSINVRNAGSSSHRSELTFALKERKRKRDMSDVRVVFSHHLDDDMIKDQMKIIAKLGASLAPCIREATHFVTDKFVRTRNMLEAIAFGKPVVTHLWLESCGQASCCIDENNYILRDANKEREFGFNLPASLARACQHPLLQGLKVWITPSTKPGVEILSSLIKAVHGLPVERIGRSVLKDGKVPDDLIVLSCKEDYAACLPFIEKGGAVFSSELLLNGIVTQKLEYDRYRLFEDHIKKTRTTMWLKQDSNQYFRVAKSN